MTVVLQSVPWSWSYNCTILYKIWHEYTKSHYDDLCSEVTTFGFWTTELLKNDLLKQVSKSIVL